MAKAIGLVASAAALAWLGTTPASGQSCVGDCNRDGQVVISEIVTGVAVALQAQPVAACTEMDANADARISVDELVRATNGAQDGCAFFALVAELPGWPEGASVRAVTPDGQVLLADDGTKGFRWTEGQAVDLGVLPVSPAALPVAGSNDGSVIVGVTYGGEGFRWVDGLIAQFGRGTYPNDISADGSIIAGYRYDGHGANLAFRWENGTLTDLGSLRPNTYSQSTAVSADGTTIVGFGQYEVAPDVTVDEAFRWRAGVLQGLGFLASGARAYSSAVAVSADGAVVAGTSHNGSKLEAFRWANGVMSGLGVLPQYEESVATAISGDGALIFGRCQRTVDNDESFTAFVWDAAHGMRELGPVLTADFGLDLGDLPLQTVADVSLDARTIVGIGEPAATWLARLGRGW